MEQRIDKCVLPNGMVLLGEPMAGVESVAFDIMLPAGAHAHIYSSLRSQ